MAVRPTAELAGAAVAGERAARSALSERHAADRALRCGRGIAAAGSAAICVLDVAVRAMDAADGRALRAVVCCQRRSKAAGNKDRSELIHIAV